VQDDLVGVLGNPLFSERRFFMRKRNVSFFGTLTCLAIAGLLAFSTNSAFGQHPGADPVVIIDGEQVAWWWGDGSAPFHNGHVIGTANIYDGGRLENYGIIGNATLTGNTQSSPPFRPTPFLRNVDQGAIGRLHIEGERGSTVENLNGSIATVSVAGSVRGGVLFNANSSSIIGTVNIESGSTYRVDNVAAATIGEVSMAGGNVFNYESGNIGRAIITGGMINNHNGGVIETLSLNGGTVNNISRIDNLTYTAGNYDGRRASSLTSGEKNMDGIGIIGTLTVAGDSRGIDWGNVRAANVIGGGTLQNDGGFIDRLNITGNGLVQNFGGNWWGQSVIGTATVTENGLLQNLRGAEIKSATVRGNGLVQNSNALIETAVVEDNGILQNSRSCLH